MNITNFVALVADSPLPGVYWSGMGGRGLRRLTAILVAAACVASLPAADLEEQREAAGLLALREPTRVIDFELTDLDGKRVSLSSFEGKVVLLNFWTTWCGPCRSEMPSMQSLYEKLSPHGLEIVAVNLQESRSTVASFTREYRLEFTVLLDSTGEIGGTYGASSIPTTYVVDRGGFAVSGIIGAIEWDTPEMRAYLGALLEQQ